MTKKDKDCECPEGPWFVQGEGSHWLVRHPVQGHYERYEDEDDAEEMAAALNQAEATGHTLTQVQAKRAHDRPKARRRAPRARQDEEAGRELVRVDDDDADDADDEEAEVKREKAAAAKAKAAEVKAAKAKAAKALQVAKQRKQQEPRDQARDQAAKDRAARERAVSGTAGRPPEFGR